MSLRHRLIGKAAQLYWRIRKPRTFGVRAIIADPEGRIALVRHTYVDRWYLPGGGVKAGESAAVALHREMREEIGVVDARIDHILGLYHSRNEGKDDHVAVFVILLDIAQAAAARAADVREIAELRWCRPDDVPPDVSPATGRRIAEFRSGSVGSDRW